MASKSFRSDTPARERFPNPTVGHERNQHYDGKTGSVRRGNGDEQSLLNETGQHWIAESFLLSQVLTRQAVRRAIPVATVIYVANEPIRSIILRVYMNATLCPQAPNIHHTAVS